MLPRLRLSRSIPRTWWTAPTRWQLTLSRALILLSGLVLFGIGEALFIQSDLGISPWAVFADGIARQLGTTIAWSSLGVSLLVVLLWIPLREPFGLGPIANTFMVPFAMDLGMRWIPQPPSWALGGIYLLAGVALIGLGSALYISCGLGAGPRQGLMTALHRLTGRPVARISTAIEITVLTIGILLGGRVGIGTLVFALTVGPAIAIGFTLVGKVGGAAEPPVASATAD
jgi:uncharacterized membrane protein YczE